jgi:hypothetical protein
MASNFPNTTDSFINPQYTKVNGVDYVKAEHINDLQDAVKNVQLIIIGSGLSMAIASNFYVPANADIKTAIEILDATVKDRENEFQAHLAAVMPNDPIQHHSNVVEVTPIGNLSSNQVQWALEELQVDIDNIMSGGLVESVTLDNRYILANGPAIVTGTLTSQGDFSAQSNVTLGYNTSHSVITSGDLTVGRDLYAAGTSDLLGDIRMGDASRIGLLSEIGYSHVKFDVDKVSIFSLKDIEFMIDSNDAIDGVAEEATFAVKNGANSTIFSLGENGWLNVQTKVATTVFEASSFLEVGSSAKTKLDYTKMAADNSSFLIQVDSQNASPNDYFAATQNGDNGATDNSTDILMKASEDKFIAGSHVQKRGVPEIGYFGIKDYSDNAGGRLKGYGVNFKSKMLTSPSSVTLNVDAVKSSNYNNLSITDLNEYGFFLEADSLAIGHWEVKGTYETVGN